MAKRMIEVALCAALIAGVAGAALAQAPADLSAKRTAAMKTLLPGANAVLASANAGDFAAASAKAKELAATVKGFETAFPAGSGGASTRAKDEIWSDAAGFKEALGNAEAAFNRLAAAADSKDAAAVDAATKGITPTCGGCHTKYRGPAV